MPKSQRIRTQVGVDKAIKVNLQQDFEGINILSLKILQQDIYTRQCSDYGVVVGRVFVNGGFGLPNAKVSVFLPITPQDSTNPIITELYPYTSISDTTEEGYRYNLLSKEPSYVGHNATGSFPTKEETLLDQSYIEVYDKYYKFTTKTNESGDFMIFGVPIGTQTIFMDVDLSDIGCFSFTPQDLIQAGMATESQVDGNQFKTSSNLNELPQVKSLTKIVEISPLWGEEDICQLGITRVDFDLTKESNIKIEPKAILMGSIMSNADDDAIRAKSCKPKNNTGNLCEMVAGPGQVLAIRQTINLDDQGLPILEQYKFEQDGKLIDGDGSYVINIPMNMDYVYTNEFGEPAISLDPKVGIPTKGKYRLKFKWNNEGGLQNEVQRANFLVPNIKEHGWTTSNSDPLINAPIAPPSVTINFPVGTLSVSYLVTPLIGNGGFHLSNTQNVSSILISINSQPYFGDISLIPINIGDIIQITITKTDPNQPSQIEYNFYGQDYFDLLRSYSFSLDWDDYVDPQSAIDCEDTFYEYHYNKVYTTALFIDRYKNGRGRAKHLGIKEIDNRTCKSNVNTFPVNDIIRNFDAQFFTFNLLINILSIPLLVILFVAHFVALMWPILKFVLIYLGILLLRLSIEFCRDTISETVHQINEISGIVSAGAGFVVNVTNILEIIRLTFLLIYYALKCAFFVALSLTFLAASIFAALRITGFPRIGLPMITYPDCASCDCDCGNATLSDDFDENSINQNIADAQEGVGGTIGGMPTSASTSNSFLAPINEVNSYAIEHPNTNQINLDDDPTDPSLGRFYCNSTGLQMTNQYKSFTYNLGQQEISSNVVVAATMNFNRIFSGSESLDPGNDLTGIPAKSSLHAPTPFLFSVDRYLNNNHRWLAFPQTETFSQKLNEFNYRQKYFLNENKIKASFNYPQNAAHHFDQPLVILARKGTLQSIGVGKLFSFQDPSLSTCNQNLTGATFFNSITANTKNQFGNNALTGTSFSATNITVTYATTNTSNQAVQYFITNTGQTETYLKNVTDIEYFQIITGYTYSEFISNSAYSLNNNRFPKKYLNHGTVYFYEWECDPPYFPASVTPIFKTTPNTITQIEGYEDYEILILTRGVDPHSGKHQNRYDISRIFGQNSENGSAVVEGEYYLNIPIKGIPGGIKPASHLITSNTTATSLYFNSYNFRISPSYVDTNGFIRNQYSAFTSNLPYYYLCPDEPLAAGYTPTVGYNTIAQLNTTGQYIMNSGNPSRNLFLPLLTAQNPLPTNTTSNYYFAGGSFTATYTSASGGYYSGPFVNNSSYKVRYWPLPSIRKFAIYSPAYFKYNPTPINYPNPTALVSQRLVMRSDRIPTSTKTEDCFNQTSFGLHQNNNFTYYSAELPTDPTNSFSSDLNLGQESEDQSQFLQSLTSTLTCENLVSLQCYTGTGVNVGVDPNCVVPPNRVVNGCYCLLNYQESDGPIFKKIYLFPEFFKDAKLLMEWKTRFTLMFAMCRGVFAQTYQNNWINGVLYMFAFNKNSLYLSNNLSDPTYEYCKDVVVYNDITNGFYYRSSPWDGNNFIGKDSPVDPNGNRAYNVKQIQFPTTVMDMGPRDEFISAICDSQNFGSYIIDQMKSTSYQDNSDLIQMGFLSRILNSTFIQQMLPIGTPSGGNSEGKGLVQFFNSNRKGDRIDGDFAQALSINSEWKVSPYIEENYPSNFLFFGNDSTSDTRPVFGVFFSSSTEYQNYRRKLTPGIETFTNNNNCTVVRFFGYSTDQIVPHYKWQISGASTNIFGSEDNNWVTTADQNATSSGFYSQYYQNLDFDNLNEYYQTSTTNFGFISNFDLNGQPYSQTNNVLNGVPKGKAIVVGAPFHFYFGLNNGTTAVDKFIKLYVNLEG